MGELVVPTPPPALGLSLSADDYHADNIGEQPSLSSSIAHLICSTSPAHARAAHPRLNPNMKREEKETFDIGTVAHAILLQGISVVEVIDAPDWRTKDARERRDAARAAGHVPLLTHVMADVEAMVDAAREQLAAHEARPALFTDGKPEQTLVWSEGDVTCRARLDWLRDDYRSVDDLKTTSRSANPEAYSRALFGVGGDVQAAFYLRGVRALTGETPEFRWCVVETQPPYALTVVAPAPDVLELGHAKVEFAIRTWRECLKTGVWSGYPQRVCWANAPDWEVARWLDRVAVQEAA